jgi:nucleotide-binding universal stress UspA family protein
MLKETFFYPIKKILLPTDGSQYSLDAAKYAAEIVKKHDSDLVSLHVVESSLLNYSHHIGHDLWGFRLAVSDETELKERGMKVMKKKQDVIRKAGILAETKYYCCGNPQDIIIEIAKKEHFDLIIMGHKGLTKLEHIRLGSVAEGVMRRAPCPVLIVR